MLNPGVDMRSASRAAEFSAVKRLMPVEGGAEWAIDVEKSLHTTGSLCEGIFEQMRK